MMRAADGPSCRRPVSRHADWLMLGTTISALNVAYQPISEVILTSQALSSISSFNVISPRASLVLTREFALLKTQ